MFCASALGALWRPLGVTIFLAPLSGVLRCPPKKRQKQFKNNGLGHFRGVLFGPSIWTFRSARAFPCSMALVFRFSKGPKAFKNKGLGRFAFCEGFKSG